MKNWRDYAALSDEELANCDIAEVELACSVGLPGAENLDVSACLERIDEWTDLARRGTNNAIRNWDKYADYRDWPEPKYRLLTLVMVLQNHLGLHFDQSLNEKEYDGRDSRIMFMHGILEGHVATCCNSPVIYAAIGRRLGYPIKIVKTTRHLFCRWDDPQGGCINFEAAGDGFGSYPDEHYYTWPMQIDMKCVEQGVFMRSLTPREELATFLANRGWCLLENLRMEEALESLRYSCELDANEPFHRNRWTIALMIDKAVTSSKLRGTFDGSLRHLRLPNPLTSAELRLFSSATRTLRAIVSRLGKRTEPRNATFDELDLYFGKDYHAISKRPNTSCRT